MLQLARALARGLLAVAVALPACSPAVRPDASSIASLRQDAEPLRTQFDGDQRAARIVVLASPT